MTTRIEGVLTAIVTPFGADGAVNLPGLRRQVGRQMQFGNGIFCNGTNGEFFVLDKAEKLLVAATCVQEVQRRVPVVSHIGEISTAATIALGQEVAALGVDAVSVITPSFVPLKQTELMHYYTAVADAVPVPVFLYNIPARTGNTIQPATAAALAQHPNIVGIKDSAGSYESLSAYLNAVRGIAGFDVLSGPDHLAHQGFLDGCSACISGLANVSPEGVSLIWKHFRAGDIARSKAAQDFIAELRKELYAIAFAPAAVKKAVALLGEDVGDSRYATLFSEQDVVAIKDIVSRYASPPKF